MDHQVKVRGFRIELGEIEAVLSRASGGAGGGGDRPRPTRRGTGGWWPTCRPRTGADRSTSAALRRHLGARLPAYMVPCGVGGAGALPLTRKGKVDRKALPAPGETAAGTAYEAPRTPAEEVLAGIWATCSAASG